MAPWQRLLLKQLGARSFDLLSWHAAQEEARAGSVPVWAERQPEGWPDFGPWQRLLLKQLGARLLDGLSWQAAHAAAAEGLVAVCDERHPAPWPPGPPG